MARSKKTTSKKPAKRGRPTLLTKDIADELFVRMLSPESLRSICADEKMPAKSTVLNWLALGSDNDASPEHAAFLDRYTRVRALQTELLLDEVPEIIDDSTNDYMERRRKDGETELVVNQENIQRSRLRMDGRFKLAEKFAPNKYGNRVDMNVGGQAKNPFLAVVEAAAGTAFVPPGAEEEGEAA